MGTAFSALFQFWSWYNDREIESLSTLESFLQHVELTMPREDFLAEINRCKTHEQEIKLIKLFYTWKPPSSEVESRYQKNSLISCEYSGKVAVSLENYFLKEAIWNSHLAFAYATDKEDFIHAHKGRSQLLHFIKDLPGALSEINEALGLLSEQMFNSKNERMYSPGDEEEEEREESIFLEYTKLKEQYETELDHILKSKNTEDHDFEKNCQAERKKRQEFTDQLFKLKTPGSPLAPALEDFIDIKYNPIRGRHLVLTKAVPIGTTILVDKPFITGLNGTLQLEMEHCHHCLKMNVKLIPCPECVFALFCNEKCLSAALSTYHKYECACLPDLSNLLTNQTSFDGVNFHLAFKLICKMGPVKLFKLFTERDSAFFPSKKECPDKILGVDPVTNIYDSSSYLTVFHLHFVSKDERGESPPEPALPLFTLIITDILDKNTDFFTSMFNDLNLKHGNRRNSIGTEFQSFVAEILLRHFHCIRNNVYSLWEMEFADSELLKDPYDCHDEDSEKKYDKSSLSIPIVKLEEILQVQRRETNANCKLEYEMNLFARGIFPSASLLSHSCDPNVMMFPRFHSDNSDGPEIAMVTVKSLKKGEELLVFYCPPFPDLSRKERRERLYRIYNFHCDCVACLDEWPTMGQLEVVTAKNKKKFCCSSCSSHLFHEMKTVNTMGQFIIDDDNQWECGNCNVEYTKQSLLNEFSMHKRALFTSLRNVNSNRPLEALNSLKLAMEFFENNIVSPFGLQILVQKFYITAIQLIVHFSR